MTQKVLFSDKLSVDMGARKKSGFAIRKLRHANCETKVVDKEIVISFNIARMVKNFSC
jgi:hypothetical protein